MLAQDQLASLPALVEPRSLHVASNAIDVLWKSFVGEQASVKAFKQQIEHIKSTLSIDEAQRDMAIACLLLMSLHEHDGTNKTFHDAGYDENYYLEAKGSEKDKLWELLHKKMFMAVARGILDEATSISILVLKWSTSQFQSDKNDTREKILTEIGNLEKLFRIYYKAVNYHLPFAKLVKALVPGSIYANDEREAKKHDILANLWSYITRLLLNENDKKFYDELKRLQKFAQEADYSVIEVLQEKSSDGDNPISIFSYAEQEFSDAESGCEKEVWDTLQSLNSTVYDNDDDLDDAESFAAAGRVVDKKEEGPIAHKENKAVGVNIFSGVAVCLILVVAAYLSFKAYGQEDDGVVNFLCHLGRWSDAWKDDAAAGCGLALFTAIGVAVVGVCNRKMQHS